MSNDKLKTTLETAKEDLELTGVLKSLNLKTPSNSQHETPMKNNSTSILNLPDSEIKDNCEQKILNDCDNKMNPIDEKELLKKLEVEAQNRMLVDMMDNTSYNNDLNFPPYLHFTNDKKCSGDNSLEHILKNDNDKVEVVGDQLEAKLFKEKLSNDIKKQHDGTIQKELLYCNEHEITNDIKICQQEKKKDKKPNEHEHKLDSFEKDDEEEEEEEEDDGDDDDDDDDDDEEEELSSESEGSDEANESAEEENEKVFSYNHARTLTKKELEEQKMLALYKKLKSDKEFVVGNEHIAAFKSSESLKEKLEIVKKSFFKTTEDDRTNDGDASFYSSSSTSSSVTSLDDDENDDQESLKEYNKGGYHSVRIGSFYNENYKIIRKVGWGYFSTVWLAWDTKQKMYAALKIVKSGWEFSDAARDEIKLLKCVSSSDPKDEGRNKIIQMLDNFKVNGFYGKHFCLAMEVMGPNLLRILLQSKQRGIPLVNVKIIMYQVLEGLRYLHQKCKIIHTDLKPENILVVPQKSYVSFSAAKLLASIKDPTSISAGMVSTQQYEAIREVRQRHSRTSKSKIAKESNLCRQDKSIKEMNICEKIDKINELLSSKDCYKEYDLLYKGKDPCKEECAIPIKIADLGNSCWTHHQFTSDIQTLQYRCVETIIRAPYDTSSDIWSAACIAFELATGDFLFDPHSTKEYSRSQHHLACFVELLGNIPPDFAKTGKLYPKFFNKKGQLRCQPEKIHSIKELLIQRYKWSRREATNFANFLKPMLKFVPQQRSLAAEMLNHEWMDGLKLEYDPDHTIKSHTFQVPQQ